MARIRTIKPEFFRHEQLQDLESAHPGNYIMLVFAGLWGHCDKAGRFEWRPRSLKLDILPFLSFDMEQTLEILKEAGLVRYYTANGKRYGEVVTFGKHQRISGKEAQEGVKHPEPTEQQQGSTGETPGKHPGAQEGSTGKGKGSEPPLPPRKRGDGASPPSADFERFWQAYPRKKNRGQAERAWARIKPDAGLVATILAAVEVAKASDDWRKDVGAFVPYPGTWLSAKGWLDDARPAGYSEAEQAVFDAYNAALGASGWPEASVEPYSPERAALIGEFLTFGRKPDWVAAYFGWLADNLAPRAGYGFDWSIRRDTYLRAREGNFASLQEAA